MKILVTGCAGFIGYHLSKRLAERGDTIVGVDNLNHYYDPALKKARLAMLIAYPNFQFVHLDIADRASMTSLFQTHRFTHVAHLAAQAGVRYSLTDPYAYLDSNLLGFGHILENSRQYAIQNLVFASSSSVYGANDIYPYSEDHPTDHPCALYGATKKANEVMAYSYAHLYQLPCTGLRFFTVYGPWGRPDMALFKFTHAILNDQTIDVYNYGDMARDFTYIDDIIEGVVRTLDRSQPYKIYNIGRGQPVALLDFINILENQLGKKAKKNMLPMQPGDVAKTFASTQLLEQDFGYKPIISIDQGIAHFLDWYQHLYECRK